VERAALLADTGFAAHRAADTESARRLLADAIAVLEADGLTEPAARTRGLLADAPIVDNRINDAVEDSIGRALLTDEPLIAGLAAWRARLAFLTGDRAFACEQADLALSGPIRAGSVVADAANTKAAALLYDGQRSRRRR